MTSDPTSASSLQPSAFGISAMPADSPAKIYDCWNAIGVEGNGSCRELVKYIHCRNCPVYSDAALQLLDRPLAPEYRREWTEHFAREKKLAAPARSSVVIFRIASEWLALPTSAFQEVAERRVMHTLPHRRGRTVLGLVNVRGELTVCVSLGRLLGFGHDTQHLKKSRTVFDRLLVTHWTGGRLAFPVDEVHGVHRFQKDDLREPPATVARSTLTYTRGVITWRDRTVGVLNADVLFASLNRSLA
jgi:chemotaxis-related protein WspD